MMNFRRAVWIVAALTVLLIFPSCMKMKGLLLPQMNDQTLSQAKQNVGAGKYQKAIDLYKTEYERHPKDRLLVKEYVKSLEEIKTAGDRALQREDFESAGKAYNVLLKNYSDFKSFTHVLSFDRAQLHSRLTTCKTALSKKGFQEYREGDLSEAITLWQDYLALDPNNTDIKKALNTAKTQQKNLQQTK